MMTVVRSNTGGQGWLVEKKEAEINEVFET